MAKVNKDAIIELNDLTLSNENVNLDNFPDFLILGPQRTGTTWLNKNLEEHPQIFFTNPKEIYFFNLLKNSNHPKYKSNDLAWYLKFFNESFEDYIKSNLKSLKAYGELYIPKVKGEGTASYAAMSKDLIKNVITLNPDIKGILMIRNPIMRGWAHAKKDLLNKTVKNIEDISDEEFYQFFSSPYQLQCGNYTSIIDNWSSFLKKGNLFIGFFDDITDYPQKLLLEIFNFLEVNSKNKYITKLSYKVINPTDKSNKRPIPQRFKIILEEIFKDEIIRLEKQFDKKLIR